MKLTEAVGFAIREALENKSRQAIVLLQAFSRQREMYIPIEASCASGLKGKVVGELDATGKMDVDLVEFIDNQIDAQMKEMEKLLEAGGI